VTAPPVRAWRSGAPFHNHQPLDLASQDPAPLARAFQDARPHDLASHDLAIQDAPFPDAAGDAREDSPVVSREETVVVGEYSSKKSCWISARPRGCLSHFASKYGEREVRLTSKSVTDQAA
jgi:hypothetical protein